MRTLSVNVPFVVALTMLSGCASGTNATSHIGNNSDLVFFDSSSEDYLLCGKCTYDFYAANPATAKGWYQLDCVATAERSTAWGTLKYNCAQGCTSCASTTQIVIGQQLPEFVSVGVNNYVGRSNALTSWYPVSIQCCPSMIQMSQHSTTECLDEGKDAFFPSGCKKGTSGGNTEFESYVCKTHLAGPKSRTTCQTNRSAGILEGSYCPTSSEISGCSAEEGPFTNSPCVLIDGEVPTQSAITKTTYTCLMDRSQQCLKIVGNNIFTNNTNASNNDISGLSCTGGVVPTVAPATYASSLEPCHYVQERWPLTEGTRHRMEFSFEGLWDYHNCNFLFTCPSTSAGMAVRVTKSVSLSQWLSVSLNASQFTGPTESFVSRDGDVDLIIGNKKALNVHAWGYAGSFAMQATCLPSSKVKVPTLSTEVNYRSKKYYDPDEDFTAYNQLTRIETNSPGYKQYNTNASRRRQAGYGANEKRAFLLHCISSDMTEGNSIVQLDAVRGSSGSIGDILTVHSLDSGRTLEFSGTIGTKTWPRSTDKTLFQASSQYYITWTSDATSDTDATGFSTATGFHVDFWCGNASWEISGVGIDVAKSGVARGAASASAIVVAIVALLLALSGEARMITSELP